MPRDLYLDKINRKLLFMKLYVSFKLCRLFVPTFLTLSFTERLTRGEKGSTTTV